ncbi:MAG: hypothetical protein DHS20C19_02100 [Acidimicrobiales bacterium]|nr:MAG: hypothetical protein DHS20C19_02100 [Acidimicrobiales bacterium]
MERFWCPREDAYHLAGDGFLRDPDISYSQPANVRRTAEFAQEQCLVMLGEPGTGKSKAAADSASLAPAGVATIPVDLAEYGSEDRLVRDLFEDPRLAEWAGGESEICLVLDSLDEAQARIPQVGSIIAARLRGLPAQRLYLRILCRTADWPTGLERALGEIFRQPLAIELLPLRRSDAVQIARGWCEPSDFIDEVVRAGAGPLAARPLTLQFLARAFGDTGTLPAEGAPLYSAGIQALCEEQNEGRRDAGLADASAAARLAITRRVAAATVFGGHSAVWLGAEVHAASDDVTIEDLAGLAEPTGQTTIAVAAHAVRDALRSALFSSRGADRLGWAHATFADFLAAEWIVANDLSAQQVVPLFLDPGGRCWPQTRLSAAWAVALAPERFAFLARTDPAGFQGEVELPGDDLRAAVVDGLFAVAESLAPGRQSYATLWHGDIAEQLRPRLRDSDPAKRTLALRLANACAALELREELESVALDVAADLEDRVAAGYALAGLEHPASTSALRELALNGSGRGSDPRDELKGVALLASWPHAISTSEAFSVLSRSSTSNFHGAYAMFMGRLRAGLGADDVDDGLRWLLADLDAPLVDSDLAGVANRLLELAAAQPDNDGAVHAFVEVVNVRVGHHEGLLFPDYRDDQPDPLASTTMRRAVAESILKAEPTDQLLFGLARQAVAPVGVVRSSDLGWLADVYCESDDTVRDAVRSLFSWTYDASVAAHRDLVLNMPVDHPLYVDLVHEWVESVAIDSPEAEWMRQRLAAHQDGPRVIEAPYDEVNEQIEQLLERFNDGDASGFWRAVRLLSAPPGRTVLLDEFNPDVTSKARWEDLSPYLRSCFIDAAAEFLLSHPSRSDEWLHKPGVRSFPAEAGYRAMLILLREAPERLDRLPTERWIEWVPALATEPTAFMNGAKWDDKRELLNSAGQGVEDAMRSALLVRLVAAVEEDRRLSLENEITYLWDDVLASRCLELVRGARDESRSELMNLLTSNDFERTRGVLLEWLENPDDASRFDLAVGQLLDNDLEESWDALKGALDRDLARTVQLLGSTEIARGYKGLGDLPAPLLVDIYLWLRERFPAEKDPQFDDAHVVGPREEIGEFRDRILARLRDAGTPDAVAAIRVIQVALPEERWLARVLAIAESALRREQWTATPLPHLLQLAANRRHTLVNDAPALSAATTSALGRIQDRLTGATPASHYLWDTHAGRPKSEDEISDYLRNELSRDLESVGAIINREVQIRRNKPSGIGERTDLLVDAVPLEQPSEGRLSLPIEVKGAWNKDLLVAAETQLVDQYMHDVSATHGLYVVAWPNLDSWEDASDRRRARVQKLDRPEVAAQLQTQAAALTARGANVVIVHLDLSYGRP